MRTGKKARIRIPAIVPQPQKNENTKSIMGAGRLHLPPLHKIKLREAQKARGAQGTGRNPYGIAARPCNLDRSGNPCGFCEAKSAGLERKARFFDAQRQKRRHKSSKKVNAVALLPRVDKHTKILKAKLCENFVEFGMKDNSGYFAQKNGKN
jgi:sRNA-binding protein